MATAVWRRLRLASSRFDVFELENLYRKGLFSSSVIPPPLTDAAAATSAPTVADAVQRAVTKVDFLEVDTLKGLPVDFTLSQKNALPDDYAFLHGRLPGSAVGLPHEQR